MVEREREGQLLKYYDRSEGVRLSWAKILANFGHTDSRVPMIRRHEVTGVFTVGMPQPIGFQEPA